MMNNGIGNPDAVAYAWPSDLLAIERNVPQGTGHRKWHEIEGFAIHITGKDEVGPQETRAKIRHGRTRRRVFPP